MLDDTSVKMYRMISALIVYFSIFQIINLISSLCGYKNRFYFTCELLCILPASSTKSSQSIQNWCADTWYHDECSQVFKMRKARGIIFGRLRTMHAWKIHKTHLSLFTCTEVNFWACIFSAMVLCSNCSTATWLPQACSTFKVRFPVEIHWISEFFEIACCRKMFRTKHPL